MSIKARKTGSAFSYPAKLAQICFVWLILSLAALGQSPGSAPGAVNTNAPSNADAKDRKPSPAPPKQLKIGKVTFSGSVRLRVENYGWWDTPGFEDRYTFAAAVARMSLGQQTDKIDWQLEGEFPLLIRLPERAVAPAPQGQLGQGGSYFAASGRQDGSAILKQAYFRVKHLFGDQPSSLRLGRMEFVDGAETNPADATLAALKRDSIAHRLIGPFG